MMSKREARPLQLYVHIPFCASKCQYCDFLSAPADLKTQEQYVRMLKQEMNAAVERLREPASVISVFFGGGTPSILQPDWMFDLMQQLRQNFSLAEDAEITVECNPGTLTRQKLLMYRQAGINRLSLGLQSASNEELRLLGRIHSYEQFLESCERAREAGFDNLNVDLMSALPGQSRASYEQTLQKVLQLQPEHLSAYSLIIEEGTPFYERYGTEEKLRSQGEHPAQLPDEETERWMYERTEELLVQHGYHRYEISNYAKEGYECRHNCGYWTGTDYLGLGLGASSYYDGCRFHQTRSLKEYLNGDFTPKELERLSQHEKMEEFMFLGLRLMRGVSRWDFQSRFSCSIEEVYGSVLQKLEEEKLLVCMRDGQIALTRHGIDVSNYVFEQFLF